MKWIIAVLVLCSIDTWGQDSRLLSCIRAIEYKNSNQYTAGGYTITHYKTDQPFNETNLKKTADSLGIPFKYIRAAENQYDRSVYYCKRTDSSSPFNIDCSTFYFFPTDEGELHTLHYQKMQSRDSTLEYEMNQIIFNNQIPKTAFIQLPASILTLGKKQIQLPAKCALNALNYYLCSYAGGFNWSLHLTQSAANENLKAQLDRKLKATPFKANSKKTMVYPFQQKRATAAQVTVLDLYEADSSLNPSLLAALQSTGARTLTIYGLVAPLEDIYISCVLSFYDNDFILPNEYYPELINQVIQPAP